MQKYTGFHVCFPKSGHKLLSMKLTYAPIKAPLPHIAMGRGGGRWGFAIWQNTNPHQPL